MIFSICCTRACLVSLTCCKSSACRVFCLSSSASSRRHWSSNLSCSASDACFASARRCVQRSSFSPSCASRCLTLASLYANLVSKSDDGAMVKGGVAVKPAAAFTPGKASNAGKDSGGSDRGVPDCVGVLSVGCPMVPPRGRGEAGGLTGLANLCLDPTAASAPRIGTAPRADGVVGGKPAAGTGGTPEETPPPLRAEGVTELPNPSFASSAAAAEASPPCK
mmetsp:Transcript_15556/g.36428  ORF Transcript_15556/g.36428 Transcript_15556/m.36428 type:complete len:222 (+) Transcript_15556:1616-2281(+)